MKLLAAALFFCIFMASSDAQENLSGSIGLQVGSKAPAFTFLDQFDRPQSNETLRGSNGTVILFFRSADWWPFCKAQLVQLQNAKERFEKQGIKLAAISYDSRAILKDFASRHKIDFPLLADPDSEIIRTFNVLNPDAEGMTAGMAFPGFYYIDASGVIREKFFTPKHTDRLTANNVIAKLFPELAAEVSRNVDAPHLQLTLSQSDQRVIPGGRVSLVADIELPPDVHVYSPGVKGYRPMQLTLHPFTGVEFQTVSYPSSKTLYLEAIKEQVPVYEGHFRISQDVTVNPAKIADALRSVISADKKISITGDLAYQACDKTICYPPTSVPVTWQLQVVTLDLKRSPSTIRHKEQSKWFTDLDPQ